MPINSNQQTFLAYWMCAVPNGPLPDAAPSSIDTVALAFAPNAEIDGQDSISLTYLTKNYPEEAIRASAKALQARGTKVIMSMSGGGPEFRGHPGGWGNLNPGQYASNVARIVMNDWGLDGVDLDNEGDYTPDDNFVEVIQALRAEIGPHALLTLPVNMPAGRNGYLAKAADQISFVSTMDYGLDFDGQIGLYQQYAELVGERKVAIGVAYPKPGASGTPFAAVPKLAAWDPADAQKAGMMLWTTNNGSPETVREWCAAIADNLPPHTGIGSGPATRTLPRAASAE
jgi:hypothetical protein